MNYIEQLERDLIDYHPKVAEAKLYFNLISDMLNDIGKLTDPIRENVKCWKDLIKALAESE